MPRLSPNVVSLWVWLMVVCGVGLGCGRPPARGPSPFDALRKDSSAVLERIAWLRQLPQRRPTRLVFHEPEAFAKVVDEQVHGDVTPTSADHPAFQHAFGFAGVRGQGVESLSNVQRDEVVAFFDERTFTVHVRADADEDPEAALKPSWVVAHEVGHSLQHQHFPIPDVARMQHEDERLAALAMLEGDAMLVMLAYASYEQHAPLARTIVRVQRAIAEDQAEQYRSMAHGSAALNRAPASVRERLVFPYLAGAGFMGSLYRAGGYPLVNRAYQHPPTTTEQVLHPEKYLAGERAVPVHMPRLPPEFQLVASGRMGELQVKTLLKACNDTRTSEQAASGWGGDAFAIGARGSAGLLLWATTWDSEHDAIEFERAIGATAACWARDLGPASGATAVLRRGLHVAVTRGLASAAAGAVLERLVALPAPPEPSVPPFGPIALPPIVAASPRVPPAIVGPNVIAPYLGLSLPIPRGFRVSLDDGIQLDEAGGAGTLMLLVSDWVVTPHTNEQLFSEFRESFLEAIAAKREQLRLIDDGAVSTPLGAGFQRTWRVGNTPVFARLVIVPACHATGALVFAQTWANPATRAELEQSVANLRPLGGGPPPLCADLSP